MGSGRRDSRSGIAFRLKMETLMINMNSYEVVKIRSLIMFCQKNYYDQFRIFSNAFILISINLYIQKKVCIAKKKENTSSNQI